MHKSESVTKGGIILAQQAIPKPNLATVMEVGTGQRSGLNGTLIPTICEVGDLIMVRAFGVTTVKFRGDEEVSLISENDVLTRIFEDTETEEEAPQNE